MKSLKFQIKSDQKQRKWAQSVRFILFSAACASILGFILNWGNQPYEIDLFSFSHELFRGLLELRIDTLSTTLLLMVSVLGALIAQYAERYLDGEQRQGYFYRWLLLTLTSVSLLITANHLMTLFFAWFSTSMSLHQLLLFYRKRPNAQKAAVKKFIVSRFGDLFLIAAIALVYHELHTLRLDEVFQAIQTLQGSGAIDSTLSLSAILFALGALTKSAQFPFHFWLPETMETPTPVSALMHAGVINAGGFLVIRLNPILQIEPLAGVLLTTMGCVTAVFASLVMITQTDIKKKLAYSTISQMGMMMIACGLGAYSLALFHIVMHSFYKAHAFLSTGNLVEESKKLSFKPKKSSIAMLLAVLSVALVMIWGGLMTDAKSLATSIYIAVLTLGVVQNLDLLAPARVSQKFSHSRVLIHIALLLCIAVGISVFFEYQLGQGLAPLVTSTPSSYPYDLQTLHWKVLCSSVLAFFSTHYVLTSTLMHSHQGLARRLYIYFWNGGYFSAFTDQLWNLNHHSVRLAQELQTQAVQTQESFHA